MCTRRRAKWRDPAARDPADIRVADVVAQFEGRSGVLPCVGDPGYCVFGAGCKLRHALIDAENSFYESLGRVTFADLLASNGATGRNRFSSLRFTDPRQDKPKAITERSALSTP